MGGKGCNTRLKDVMKKYKLRQVELARAAEVNNSHLSLILNGWKKVTPDMRQNIRAGLLELIALFELDEIDVEQINETKTLTNNAR